MKDKYIAPDMTEVKLAEPGVFLKGSLADVPIKVGTVSVEEFQDGFADDGGFKDITFD